MAASCLSLLSGGYFHCCISVLGQIHLFTFFFLILWPFCLFCFGFVIGFLCVVALTVLRPCWPPTHNDLLPKCWEHCTTSSLALSLAISGSFVVTKPKGIQMSVCLSCPPHPHRHTNTVLKEFSVLHLGLGSILS